jgi:hypothetical protein
MEIPRVASFGIGVVFWANPYRGQLRRDEAPSAFSILFLVGRNTFV